MFGTNWVEPIIGLAKVVHTAPMCGKPDCAEERLEMMLNFFRQGIKIPLNETRLSKTQQINRQETVKESTDAQCSRNQHHSVLWFPVERPLKHLHLLNEFQRPKKLPRLLQNISWVKKNASTSNIFLMLG